MRGLARHLIGAAALALLLGACAMEPPAPDYAAIIAAPDRTDADRKNDERREPVKLLAFTGVHPGWKVLDMGAGGGYSTELMARGAAPNGIVYGQNPPDLIARAKNDFIARMKHPAMKNVIDDTRPFDDPLPADVHGVAVRCWFDECQRSRRSPHWRSRDFPADGHGKSPRTATGCPQGRPRELPADGKFSPRG